MAVLLHGDCLDVMKTLPDKSVDLFVCDLPYGCLSSTDQFREWSDSAVMKGCPWDIKIDLDQFWTQVKRLCKDDHTPVIHFCTTKFGVDLINSNPSWFRYDLVWNKNKGVGFLNANKMPMRSHEMIYVFAKKGARYYRKDYEGEEYKKWVHKGGPHTTRVYRDHERPDAEGGDGTRCVLSVIDVMNTANKRDKHPTQKPDTLYDWLIERYSKEGDTVLDATAGSFASVFAAQRLGRKGVGIEKAKEFYDKAVAKAAES